MWKGKILEANISSQQELRELEIYFLLRLPALALFRLFYLVVISSSWSDMRWIKLEKCLIEKCLLRAHFCSCWMSTCAHVVIHIDVSIVVDSEVRWLPMDSLFDVQQLRRPQRQPQKWQLRLTRLRLLRHSERLQHLLRFVSLLFCFHCQGIY